MIGHAGYALGPDEGERLRFGDSVVLLRATATTTAGAFTISEELAPLLDTPMHVRANEDELFHIIDGEHEFRSDVSRRYGCRRAAVTGSSSSVGGARPGPGATTVSSIGTVASQDARSVEAWVDEHIATFTPLVTA